MPIGAFLTHDEGYKGLLSGEHGWETDAFAAVLIDHAHGAPDRAAETLYSHIYEDECDDEDYSQHAIDDALVEVADTNVRFTCGKITFTDEGTINGRYLYIVKGTAGALTAMNPIIGHLDLTGDANADSKNSEFSYTPNADGLFYILRTAAPAV